MSNPPKNPEKDEQTTSNHEEKNPEKETVDDQRNSNIPEAETLKQTIANEKDAAGNLEINNAKVDKIGGENPIMDSFNDKTTPNIPKPLKETNESENPEKDADSDIANVSNFIFKT